MHVLNGLKKRAGEPADKLKGGKRQLKCYIDYRVLKVEGDHHKVHPYLVERVQVLRLQDCRVGVHRRKGAGPQKSINCFEQEASRKRNRDKAAER